MEHIQSWPQAFVVVGIAVCIAFVVHTVVTKL